MKIKYSQSINTKNLNNKMNNKTNKILNNNDNYENNKN